MIKTAVILAAGMGVRLADVMADRPKGFLEVGGESLLERSVQALLHRGVTDVIIVTGHLAEHFVPFAQRHPEVRLVHNPFYADSGSMYSLYCARDMIDAPFFLLESDIIYEPRALSRLQQEGDGPAVLMSGLTHAGDEVYVCAPGGMLRAMSKIKAELETVSGELVGICSIDRHTFERMIAVSEAVFKKTRHLDYEYCLVACAGETVIPTVLIEDLLWGEIDEAAHHHRVLTSILPRIEAKEANHG